MSELAIPHQEAEQEVMPSFHFLLEDEAERTALVAEHRNWLRSIRRIWSFHGISTNFYIPRNIAG